VLGNTIKPSLGQKAFKKLGHIASGNSKTRCLILLSSKGERNRERQLFTFEIDVVILKDEDTIFFLQLSTVFSLQEYVLAGGNSKMSFPGRSPSGNL
jgi:hypothetical protein